MRKHLQESIGAITDVGGLLGKEVEEPLLAWQKALQKSRHIV
jgi:hypothetical protein